ncbi:hypothetical protein GH714_010401 [Hevea brasiliensis]|uniref:ABC transporter domain-containing protein n=1 Tax=Hevea brasiliensis TaxID=3981 RepID=A0A6A6KD98_HEVBR|nr:hypothetical protein GH714_010401 [Hevea brasiliensis]
MALEVKAPVSGGRKSSYRLETRNLSYKLCSKFDELNWGCFGRTPLRVPKFILKDVNCEARPGEITAIAGPSGAGKTTLLDILAGKVCPREVSDQVLVNNRPMDAKHFRRISGYVTQDDALFPLLTVQETLMYSALLRLPGGQKEAATRVKRLMKELGLDHVAASRIGLDSASALHVLTLLKSMAVNQGKTIILTIHQPGFRILEQFDRIVLLSNGFVMHNGSLHFLEERLKFGGHHIPSHVNVLEFTIDVMESLEDQNSVPLCLQSKHEETCMMSIPQEKLPSCWYPNSALQEVLILGQRFCSNIFRTKQLFATRIIQALVAGLVLGTIFLNAGNETDRPICSTSLSLSPSSLKPTTPLFLRPPTFSTSLSELNKWHHWAKNLASSVGSSFVHLDNGPDSTLLCRELRWLLEDSLEDHSLISQLGSQNYHMDVRLRASLDELYVLWRQRIEERRPFQYIVGCEHWRDLVLSVQEGVLIPRPETELIVDLVKDVVLDSRELKEGLWADLGTGSGAIAIGIGRILWSQGRVIATDLSPVAVAVATYNVLRYDLKDMIEVRKGSWFEPLKDVEGKLAGVTNGEKQCQFLVDYMENNPGKFCNVNIVSDFAGIQRCCYCGICASFQLLLRRIIEAAYTVRMVLFTLLSNGSVMDNDSLHFLEERLVFAAHHILCGVILLEFAIDAMESLSLQNSMHLNINCLRRLGQIS